MKQVVRVMHPLGVARHLGADHALRVAVVGSGAHASDGALVEDLDLERAGRRTIMRAGGCADPYRVGERSDRLVHCGVASDVRDRTPTTDPRRGGSVVTPPPVDAFPARSSPGRAPWSAATCRRPAAPGSLRPAPR